MSIHETRIINVISKLHRERFTAEEVLFAVIKIYSVPLCLLGFTEALKQYTSRYITRKLPQATTYKWLTENLTVITDHYLELRKPFTSELNNIANDEKGE